MRVGGEQEGGWMCQRLRGHMVVGENKDLEELWAF